MAVTRPLQRQVLTTYLKYVLGSGVAGQTISSASYVTLNLNFQSGDTSFCSLSSNQIILDPGKYEIYAAVPMSFTGASSTTAAKVKLRNITDASDVWLSVSGRASEANGRDGDKMIIVGELTLTESKTLELQLRGSSVQVGYAVNFGDSEIYQQIQIRKVA